MEILTAVKALTFDVFGTVVDMRSAIGKETAHLGNRLGVMRDWGRFADDWTGRYGASVAAVNSGKRPWTEVDALNREALDHLLGEYDIAGLSEAEKESLNNAWHRLDPWPDSVPGIRRLRTRYKVATLANGNVSLLTDLATYAGLPWNSILSAEMVKRYKPDRLVYQLAVDRLHLRPAEIMMVAAHKYDLRAARALNFRTAFVARPLERGPGGHPDLPAAGDPFDMTVCSLEELAAELEV